ncbi:MAG: selenide, water dikinase SelD [Prochloron sp. SP5CPC1]|nr:selenide, water dikinase SelD [Candidatus Paraprochloron terpiosi SP5CPC1]
MQQHSIEKDLVLIGGGHSHAIALKLWGMEPIPGVRLTLITDTSHTPYSGMLPGHVAGFYSYDETHIDLRRLASFAGAQLYLDQAIGLDLVQNKVLTSNHPPVAFDYLSLDIGSTPATMEVPGAEEYAIPAKPVPQFLQGWNDIVTAFIANPHKPLTLAIVGGGAGGVELALNINSRLRKINPSASLTIHLFHGKSELLLAHNEWVSRRLKEILLQRGIKLHLSTRVIEVQRDRVICDSGLNVECDRLFWVTQASAPSWIKDSGLTIDSQGFILVEDTLQSVSHTNVFATGDIGTMKNYTRPKAGVFAVRQGKPLFINLQRIIKGKKLRPYQPQKRFLGLIGTGDKKAVASWSSFGWQSSLLWQWKDYIDRKFMNRFSHLPPMSAPKQQQTNNNKEPPQHHCKGCGSKVGSTVLEKVFQRLTIEHNDAIIIGMNQPDDGAVVKVPASKLMVHTIDYFPSLINDPFIFGKIATNHCLSDIFAMGATPQTALAVATIPYGNMAQVEETLYQLLSGATQILHESEVVLVGGHTTAGAELAFGLSCNGVVDENKILRKSGMKPGQVLVLTKAIGTGTLFAADMKSLAKGRWIDGAVASMLLSNGTAGQILRQQGATACTDITGFGLLGHLGEMVKASGVRVELDVEAIPILPGALETVEMGIYSELQPQNLRASQYIDNVERGENCRQYPLLFDPQTSGGLLASIDEAKAGDCIIALKSAGYTHSSIIGRITLLPPLTAHCGLI